MKSLPGHRGLSICETHKAEIRSALEAAGLKDFIREDGQSARRFAERIIEGVTVDNFDPFYDLQVAAVMSMISVCGMRLIAELRLGETVCVVCRGVEIHAPDCDDPKCAASSSTELFRQSAEKQVGLLATLTEHEVKH